MSEQKPKIDLKARLGKKPVPAAGGSSIPPPMASSPSGMPPGGAPAAMGGMAPGVSRPSMPRPSGAPPATTPSGVPIPPFGQPSRPAPAASNPYAGGVGAQPVAAVKPTAIRIEMGEEVMAAQRAGRKKVLFLAAIAFLVGGGVGFTAGGGAERAKGADAAIAGAQDLVKDIAKANAEVQKLADTLKSAKEKLSKGAFPEEEVSKLGGINIPFTGKNLSGKGIGRFKPEVVAQLIEYANGTTAANEQKEKVQNVLTGAKKGIVELLEQQSKPQVRWAALLTGGPGGPWAGMQMIPAPFGAKDKWPEEVKVNDKSFKRYQSGNPIREDSPFFIPVDPGSQSSVCPSDTIFKLRRELNDLEEVLRGDNTPGADRPGLIDQAQKLTVQLNKIGSAAP